MFLSRLAVWFWHSATKLRDWLRPKAPPSNQINYYGPVTINNTTNVQILEQPTKKKAKQLPKQKQLDGPKRRRKKP